MRQRGIRHRRWIGIALSIVLPASASELADFVGTWTFDKSRSSDLDAAIDACAAKTNFVVRAIARPRLKKTNTPYERISISGNAADLKIAYGAKEKVVAAPCDGKPVPWIRENGEVVQLSHELKAGNLVEIFRGEDGAKIETFSVSSDRSILAMDVKVTSPKLPEPLVYRLVYVRKS